MQRKLIENPVEFTIVCDTKDCDYTINYSKELDDNLFEYIEDPCLVLT